MMISVLRLLQDVDTELKITGETGGIEEKICITRSKGRFGQPTSGGWADIMINFYFQDDEERWAHICEIQLVHAQLYGVRKNMGAHSSYNDFRAALELCKKVGADPEVGCDANVLEALVWKPKRRVTAGRGTQIRRQDDNIAVLESQVEMVATVEAQNEKLAAQMTKMNALEAQNERMAAQMEKVDVLEAQNEIMSAQNQMLSSKVEEISAALATLTSQLSAPGTNGTRINATRM
jgi:hypothetical protein